MNDLFRSAMLAAVAGTLVVLGAPNALATTYYLQNVEFADGTFATGSFSTNVSGYVNGYDIVTRTGTITGYDYTDTINVTYNPGDATIVFYHATPSYDGYLSLTGVSAIDSGATDSLATGGASYECSSYACPSGTARIITSGSLTTVPPVPEPASWALMITGFALIGAAARHRARVATQVTYAS